MTPLLVALGAAVGAPLRYVAATLLDPRLASVALGTLLVNVVGSFVLGALSGAAVDGEAMALLGVGFCGGLTTYSAFAVQTAERGRWGPAYAAVTIVGSLGACALGFAATAG